MSSAQNPDNTIYSTRTPREEWPDRFRTVVELFEASEKSRPERGAYHAEARAPLRPGGENEYTWHVLFAPERVRNVWKVDGQPLRTVETVHGNDGSAPIATDDDITDIEYGRVEIYAALTCLAGIHSRSENWLHGDDAIEEQFDAILDELEVTHR